LSPALRNRLNWRRWFQQSMKTIDFPFSLLLTLLAAVAPTSAQGTDPQDCVRAALVLWGDGRHDDTVALNAWLRGADAIWAESGAPVGDAITGRRFRLSAAVYVQAGTGRALREFYLHWPERGEHVTGVAILAGADPDQAPILSAVSIIGGDAGEGVPFEMPEPASPGRDDASCATS
jgi:hypothetical protein